MIKIVNQELTLKISSFSDGTQKVIVLQKPNEEFPDKVTIYWRFKKESEILTLFYVVHWLRDHKSDVNIHLNIDYVPYARMDRVEEPEDVFTLKYFSELLNSLNINSIQMLDPHSRVAPALISRSKTVLPFVYIRETLNQLFGEEFKCKKLTVLFPDRGAYERYVTPQIKELFAEFGIKQFIYGEKTRDWSTSTIQSFYINLRGIKEINDVLIMDDIITTGGTIQECIQEIDDKASGRIFIYTTFLEGAAFERDEFLKVLLQCERIFTPHTTPIAPRNISNNKLVIFENQNEYYIQR